MKIGDEYLKIHYELQELYYLDNISKEQITEVSNQMKKMAAKDKPTIHLGGKWLAKKAIENKGEMKTWWK
jgi:hypothetical protein